jgi:phospholipid/cholesterol/gamma-HCH transport system substrate-binding protein
VLRRQPARFAALAALAIAVVAIAVILLTSGSDYVVHAEFYDAGQLVKGDLVTVAGHPVGSIGGLTLAPDGLAEITLDISDHAITPIGRGTLATIGQLSLTGVANRFVALTLGGGAPIPDGGTLAVGQTRGIVDLDVLLDALTPRVRGALQQILKAGAFLVTQPTAAQLNRAAAYLNPALSQTAQLGGEIAADRVQLQSLVSATAQIATDVAARDGDLDGAVTHTAVALREVASDRSALGDAIGRAPAVLHQATHVLGDTDRTLTVLTPVLRELQPVAPRLATLLRGLAPAAKGALPMIAGLQALAPKAKSALLAFGPVEKQATPAVHSLAAALGPITPILAGLRPYAPDVVAGFFNGVGGASAGSYDANGHYLKAELTLESGGGSLSGLVSLLGPITGKLGPFDGARTGLLAPCPGGGGPPAPDGSNPWTLPDVPNASSLCKPADDQR